MSAEIIRNMSEPEYRARSEASQTQFKAHRLPTAAHAQQELSEEKDEEKDCLLNGQALHALALEGKKIYRVAKVTTQKNPKQDGAGILLSPHNAAIVEGMAAGIMRNGDARAVLADRLETEVSIFWDGMKARLDAVCSLGVLDLKSCRKFLTERDFSAQIEEYGYHIQAAHYLEAAALAGFPAEDFRFICVENSPPFCCRVFRLSHLSIEIGRMELKRLRKLYFECKESGLYPGYPEVDQEIELPGWKLREEGEE